ncbi:DNA-binding protein [Yersinia frederiksenii]|nr:DNA-binding protein [Yersinia frederiksenii]
MASLYSEHNNRKQTGSGITTTKAYLVPYSELYIEDGYNIRDEIDNNQVEELAQAYKDSDYVPPLVVEVMPDNRKKIIDGHHRYLAAGLAIDRGLALLRLPCTDAPESEADKIVLMMKSSQGKNITALERAKGFVKLKKLGWTNEEIAQKFKRSISDIVLMFDLAECPDEIKVMVKDNTISYANAVELVRKHGVNAIEEAQSALNTAKEAGKKKITKSQLQPQYSAKKARRLVELLSSATPVTQDGHHYLMLVDGDNDEVLAIINDYMKEDKSKDNTESENNHVEEGDRNREQPLNLESNS